MLNPRSPLDTFPYPTGTDPKRIMKLNKFAMLFIVAASLNLLARAASTLYFTSSQSSWIGRGQTVNLSSAQGIHFSAHSESGHTLFAFINSDAWELSLSTGDGSPFAVGTYTNTQRFGFQPGMPVMEFTGSNRYADLLNGWFNVLSVTQSNGSITSMAVDFLQCDEGSTSNWVRGAFRYNSDYPVSLTRLASMQQELVPRLTDNIESAVLHFPECSQVNFRPDAAVECANVLIRAGRGSACEEMKRLAHRQWPSIQQQEQVNRNICLLCRLVFDNKNSSEHLRAPRVGLSSGGGTYEPNDEKTWPYLPFAITNGVPLCMTSAFLGSGMPDQAADYLAYCASNGVFRAHLFPEPTAISSSNALKQVISSSAWKALNSRPGASHLAEENAEADLWKEIKNMQTPASAPTTPRGHGLEVYTPMD